MTIKRLLGATALVGVLAGLPSIAAAQTAPATPPAPATADTTDSDADAGKDVVVTGSRIARPNDSSTVPVTTVSAAELTSHAKLSIGDVLNDLPALQSTFSQSNSTRFLGTAGLNLLDLRGLGTQRTLVLVNGRRHVGADILNNAVSPDVNTFPTDLIERVDVVTGGDSAVYGSDALAGVVNFVLKDHFQGLQFHAQGGVSSRADAGTYYASVLAGKNFADGRGNIAIDLEYARQNSLYAADRDYLARNDTFLTVQSDASGLTTGFTTPNNNGQPDAVFYRDVRVATFSDGGLISFNSPTGACGTGGPTPTAPLGQRFSCTYLFQPDGSLVQETGTRVGLGSNSATPTGSYIGGNGNTRRNGTLLQILPQQDRYSANLIGHFDISDALVPFVEAKYVRTDTFGQGGSGPAFFTGSTIDGFYERPRLDNPYLSAQARSVITAQLIAGGTNPASITDATRFTLRKNLTDLGTRSEQSKRETFRIVGGLRGTFNDDWKYELSANYGQFNEKTRVLGNVNVQRELLALDAVKNSSGQIVCGSQIDATRAYDDFGGNAANLAADIAACKPLNPFGVGSISQAAKDYVLQNTVSTGKITQLDLTGFVSGNSSKFFSLPGGPVGFALGAEYRRETAFFQEDPLVEKGYTFYNAISKFAPPAFVVKEAFAELRLPILKDQFIHELTVSGAGRVSDYNGSAGTVYTYNAGVDFAPIPDIRFRANYSRAIRAPNLSDLYSPQSQNFAPGFSDPCSARNIAGGTQYRAANCAAAGIPTTYDFVYAQSLQILSGGNPSLKVEKSDSYTYGVVLQPRFVPGLSLSVDYYNIKVNNVITAPSAQGIVNSCYDSPTTNNQFCALFKRNLAAAIGPKQEVQYQIFEGSLQQTLLNYAKLQVRGIDVDLSYQHRFGGTKLSTHLIYTHQLQKDSFLDPTQPGFADTTVGELGSPRDSFNWNINADFGRVFVDYQLRYLSKMSVGAIENHITFQGRPPQNADDFDIPYYPEVVYMDVRFGINLAKGSNFYFGIDNLTDRLPPLGATATGAGSAIYDPIGRRFYAGVTAKF
ncbi:TonB-dependent receptor [Sphingomonas sp. RT2P30]|uniref:TonB-dependent receptor domain-containing protein n=1 Tax=Parasphingomonas halimpatiens TaxID=3096162 RepID=UPI002FCA0C34